MSEDSEDSPQREVALLMQGIRSLSTMEVQLLQMHKDIRKLDTLLRFSLGKALLDEFVSYPGISLETDIANIEDARCDE